MLCKSHDDASMIVSKQECMSENKGWKVGRMNAVYVSMNLTLFACET